MYHSAIAEARALDCDEQEGRKVRSCASQSNAAYIPRQWPVAIAGRPHYVTRKQELRPFAPLRRFVVARCGSLFFTIHKLTKLIHTLSYILI